MQTHCNLPSPNQLQAYKGFHSKTTVVPAFAYPTTKIHSRTHRLIRPFNWFEELNVLFSTTEAMTLPLNGAFSCYRTQHPTGVGACARARRDAQTRQGAPALIRTMHACAQVARGEKRPADGDYGAPTARRHCSGARGAIPMGSTGPTRCARRALVPQAVWR